MEKRKKKLQGETTVNKQWNITQLDFPFALQYAV